MFDSIEAGIQFLRKKDMSQYQEELYVPLQGKYQLSQETSFKLEDCANQFLKVFSEKKSEASMLTKQTDKKVMLLLGSSGSGKSLFCQQLMEKLWRSYGSSSPIPLYIPLASVNDPVHKLIEETLENIGFNEAQTLELQKQHRFIFIFDGYDELYLLKNLYATNKIHQWRAKTIITCSEHAVYYLKDFSLYFMPFQGEKRQPDLLETVWVSTFEDSQIDTYLKSYHDKHHTSGEENVVTRALFDKIPGLSELIKTPFLLKIAVESIPSLLKQISLEEKKPLDYSMVRAELYDIFITSWFARQEKKLKDSGKVATHEVLGPTFWNLCKTVALYLQVNKTSLFDLQKARTRLKKETSQNSLDVIFQDETNFTLMRTACLIKKIGNQYGFIHESFIEYFVTRALYEETIDLNNKQVIERQSLPLPFETLKTEEEKADTLVGQMHQRCFTREPGMIKFLADRVEQDPEYKNALLQYVKHSSVDKRYQTASTNAFTILIRANVPVAGMNLKRIQIPMADISHAILDNTQLEGANLDKVLARNTWLRDAFLVDADMNEMEFGECPNIILEDEYDDFCFSSDGKYLAVAVQDCICLYETSTYESIRTFEMHRKKVLAISIDKQGKYLASGGDDNKIIIWNISTGTIMRTFEITLGEVKSVAFTDNWELFSVSTQEGLFLFHMETGEFIQVLEGSSYENIVFSPNNKLLAGISGGTVAVFHWSDNTKQTIEKDEKITSVVFSKQGQYIAVARGGEPTVEVLHAMTLQLFREIKGPSYEIKDITFSPNDDYIGWGGEDGIVRFWETATGKCFNSFTGHSEKIRRLQFSSDGQYLAVGARSMLGAGNRQLRIWKEPFSQSLQPVVIEKHGQRIDAILYSHKHHCVVTQSVDAIHFWRLADGKQIEIFKKGYPTNRMCGIAFAPSEDYLAIGGKDLQFWNIKQDCLMKTISGFTRGFIGLAFHPEGKSIAVATVNHGAILIDVEKGEPIHYFKAAGVLGYCAEVAFSPKGDFLLTKHADMENVRLWDVNSGSLLEVFTVKKGMNLSNIAFSPKGDSIAYHDEIDVLIWQVKNKHRSVFVGHKNIITSLTYNPSGEYLVSGCEDGSVHLWNVKDQQLLAIVKGPINAIKSIRWIETPDGNFLATGGEDKTVRLWQMTTLNNQFIIILRWSSQQTTFTANGAMIGQTQNLSPVNKKLLIQRGARDDVHPINLLAREEATQKLIVAVSRNNKTEISLCVAKSGNPNAFNHEGHSLVKIAITNRFHEALNLLVGAGADIHQSDIANNTLLHLAVKSRHPECVLVLSKTKIRLNKPNYHGETPLQLAFELALTKGESRIFEILLVAGANPDICFKNGKTPLSIASSQHRDDLVNLINNSKKVAEYKVSHAVSNQQYDDEDGLETTIQLSMQLSQRSFS